MVVLEALKAVIDNFGSAIVVPFIIFIIALIFRVKPAKAFLSALYAGVSLEGFSLIIGAIPNSPSARIFCGTCPICRPWRAAA